MSALAARPRLSRVTVLAASIAISAALGSVVGALAAAAFVRPAAEPAAESTTTAAGIVPEDFRPDQFVGLLRNSMVVRSLGARVDVEMKR